MKTFSVRLRKCTDDVGGMGALAKATKISKSQLQRYVNAEADPPLAKLRAIADAAGVKLSWLIEGGSQTGQYTSQVVLDKEVFLEVVEQVEKVLMNAGRVLAPERKALFVFVMTKAVEQGQDKDRSHLLSEKIILQMLDYMSACEGQDEARELFQAIEHLSTETNKPQAEKWAHLIVHANMHFYDTPSGRKYFEYLPDITGNYARSIDYVLQKAENFRTIGSVLDFGCGNGRYLKYIHEVRPDLKLKGVDTSLKALRHCRYLEEVGALPPETFIQADMRLTPLPNSSFDLIIARGSLFCFPFHQAGGSPLESVFKEVYRLLKPGGVFHGLTRAGKGISFYHGHQLMDEKTIIELAKAFGFEPFGIIEIDVNERLAIDPKRGVHERFKNFISFELVKPLTE